jgi:hypothetical protein
MDSQAIAAEVYGYSAGYPFLVSRICQLIDERYNRDWTREGVRKAGQYLINEEKNTLFDDIFKNLEAYQDLYHYMYTLLFWGTEKPSTIDAPVVDLALMFGFVKNQDGKIKAANRIFEIRMANYFLFKESETEGRKQIKGIFRYDVVKEGRFDMELCLRRFAKHYRQIFNKKDAAFLERHGRLVFLSFLTPLIKGEGFYYIESETTDALRMDLVVSYGMDEFIIELNIWRGHAAHGAGYEQLAEYLPRRGRKEGYLLTFDVRKESNREPPEVWLQVRPEGKGEELRIFHVML